MTRTGLSLRAAAILALLPLACASVRRPVALDPTPSVDLDRNLVGTFACVPFSGAVPKDGQLNLKKGDPFSVLQSQAVERRYSMTLIPADKAAKDVVWDAYPSALDDRTILNAEVVPEETTKKKNKKRELVFVSPIWVARDLFRLDSIDLAPLGAEPISPAAALRSTLQTHKDDKAVFKFWLLCTRARELKN